MPEYTLNLPKCLPAKSKFISQNYTHSLHCNLTQFLLSLFLPKVLPGSRCLAAGTLSALKDPWPSCLLLLYPRPAAHLYLLPTYLPITPMQLHKFQWHSPPWQGSSDHFPPPIQAPLGVNWLQNTDLLCRESKP